MRCGAYDAPECHHVGPTHTADWVAPSKLGKDAPTEESAVDKEKRDWNTQRFNTSRNEVSNRIDCRPDDALDYCNEIIILTESLRDRIEDYIEE